MRTEKDLLSVVKQMFGIQITPEIREAAKLISAKNKENLEIANRINLQIDRSIGSNICDMCGALCCKILPPELGGSDIIRLAKTLKINKRKFLKKYTHIDEKNLVYLNSPCPFLEDNKCTVYHSRPEICREYPFVMGNISGFPCMRGMLFTRVFGLERLVGDDVCKKQQKLLDERDPGIHADSFISRRDEVLKISLTISQLELTPEISEQFTFLLEKLMKTVKNIETKAVQV